MDYASLLLVEFMITIVLIFFLSKITMMLNYGIINIGLSAYISELIFSVFCVCVDNNGETEG